MDVERFASDDDESMAARGMGAVHTTASDLQPLRRPLSEAQHEDLMRAPTTGRTTSGLKRP